MFRLVIRVVACIVTLCIALHAILNPYPVEKAANYALAIIAYTYIHCVVIAHKQDTEGRP
jgi:hypothetical protein